MVPSHRQGQGSLRGRNKFKIGLETTAVFGWVRRRKEGIPQDWQWAEGWRGAGRHQRYFEGQEGIRWAQVEGHGYEQYGQYGEADKVNRGRHSASS